MDLKKLRETKWLQTILLIVAASISFVAGREGVIWFRNAFIEENTDLQAYYEKHNDEIKDELAVFIDDAKKKSKSHQAESETEALRLTMNELAEERFATLGNKEKIQTAANNFSGYYGRQTLGMHEYCRQFDIDLSPYVETFKSHNAGLYAIAEKYYTAPDQVEIVYEMLREQLMPLIESEMQELSNQYDLTQEEVCKLINESAYEIVQNASFETMLPAAYAILIGEGK